MQFHIISVHHCIYLPFSLTFDLH